MVWTFFPMKNNKKIVRIRQLLIVIQPWLQDGCGHSGKGSGQFAGTQS